MKKSLRAFGLGMAMAVATLAATSTYGADAATKEKSTETEQKKLAVGDQAPAWKDLEGVDGKQHSLGEHASAKAIAVIFTCNHCPVAVAYEDRIVALADDYKAKGVEIVAINVNNYGRRQAPSHERTGRGKGLQVRLRL